MGIDFEDRKKQVEARRESSDDLFKKHFVTAGEDLQAVVLKGHLLIERHLTGLLEHYCHDPTYLTEAKLQFSQKVSLVRAIVYFPFEDNFWGAMRLLNQLRNDLAHELEPKKLDEHLAAVRILAEALQKNTPEGYAKEDLKVPAKSIAYLCSFWIGFLTALDAAILYMEKNRHYGEPNDSAKPLAKV